MASTAASHPITAKETHKFKDSVESSTWFSCTCRDESISHAVSKLTFSGAPKDDFSPHSTSSTVPSAKNE